MTEAVLMQDSASNTSTGDASSQAPASESATAEKLYGDQQQASERQTDKAEEQPADGQAEGDEEGAKPEGAPEKYEFKAPDGQEFDAEVVSAYSEVAKELNLSQDAAQKVLDKVAPVMQARALAQVEAVRNQWADTSRADKEFGGDKLNENLAVAKKALDQFGTPELSKLLNESGLGNNPEVIRFMFRAGKAISEDRYVGADQGKGGKAGPKNFNDFASALYSDQQT